MFTGDAAPQPTAAQLSTSPNWTELDSSVSRLIGDEGGDVPRAFSAPPHIDIGQQLQDWQKAAAAGDPRGWSPGPDFDPRFDADYERFYASLAGTSQQQHLPKPLSSTLYQELPLYLQQAVRQQTASTSNGPPLGGAMATTDLADHAAAAALSRQQQLTSVRASTPNLMSYVASAHQALSEGLSIDRPNSTPAVPQLSQALLDQLASLQVADRRSPAPVLGASDMLLNNMPVPPLSPGPAPLATDVAVAAMQAANGGASGVTPGVSPALANSIEYQAAFQAAYQVVALMLLTIAHHDHHIRRLCSNTPCCCSRPEQPPRSWLACMACSLQPPTPPRWPPPHPASSTPATPPLRPPPPPPPQPCSTRAAGACWTPMSWACTATAIAVDAAWATGGTAVGAAA